MRGGKGGREIGIENCNLVQKLVILPTYPSGVKVKGKVLICFISQIMVRVINLDSEDLKFGLRFANHYLCIIGQVISFSVSEFLYLQNKSNKTCTCFFSGREGDFYPLSHINTRCVCDLRKKKHATGVSY